MITAILIVMVVVLAIFLNHTWKEKEHYRCRVFELTNGEEGSNLVKVVPTTPAPTPPEKPLEEEKPKRPRVRLYDDWKFINLETCGAQSCLDRLADNIQKDGYKYIASAGTQTILAFHKLWSEELKDEDNDRRTE